MHDTIEQRVSLLEPNKKITPPASWFRGRYQVDGVLLSQSLLCSKAILLPFWASIGDHRPIVVDIPAQVLYASNTYELFILSVGDFSVGNLGLLKITVSTLKKLRLHIIDKQYQSLAADLLHLTDEDFSQRHECIDSIKKDMTIAGDKQCRTYKVGIVDFLSRGYYLEETWRILELSSQKRMAVTSIPLISVVKLIKYI